MADTGYPRDVHNLKTRHFNPFIFLTTVKNGQGAVDAYERRVERRCDFCNPFSHDKSCANAHPNGGVSSTAERRPTQFAATNPFLVADSQSHGPPGEPGACMPPSPTPDMHFEGRCSIALLSTGASQHALFALKKLQCIGNTT